MAKRKQKNNFKTIGGVVAIALVISIVAVGGIITIGNAQQSQSDVAELTDLANSLGGNIDAFMAGLAYIGEGASGLIGGSTSDDWEVGGDLSVTGNSTLGLLITGGGAYNSTTTDANTYTFVSGDIATYSYLDLDYTGAADITYTMPATSTMMTLLPSIGSTRIWTIHNASTTGVLTLATGAGMNLLGIDTNVDTIAADGWATLECMQTVYNSAVNENIACLMAEYLVAD